MKYIKLVIGVADEYQEGLIAELFDMDFDGFEQRDGQIITYIAKENFGISDRERIDQLLAAYPGNGFIESEEVVADQNWNEQWEQTIQAQEIGHFFVKPTWSRESVPEDKILLEIDPKMSFGTGYHETTRLVLKMLPESVNAGDIVIDAGTGTGILSIAAVKLGAAEAFAFDIDEWSISNTQENILLNDVSGAVSVKKGSADAIPEGYKADLLLANIERNTILELLPDFDDALKAEGTMILSGLLKTDEAAIRDELKSSFRVEELQQENEWIALKAKKLS